MVLSALFGPGRHASEERLAHALRSVPLFRDMPAADLVAIWRRLQEVRVPAGTVICERGDPGDGFYIVQAGTLEVRLGLGPAGVVVRHILAGDFVGEMALLTGEPRSADVVALEDAVLWLLSRDEFAALLDSRVSLLRAFVGALCDRLARTTQLLEERGAATSGGVAGLRVGPYHVVEQIGAGGMAVVYSAVHAEGETVVALKLVPVGWGAAAEWQARLAREAAALRVLDHPHVVKVLDVGEVDVRLGGGWYLAMEWLPQGLDRILRAQYPQPLTPTMALRVAQAVAEGLAAVHAAGFIHRDVKPSNIMLRANGTPVLTDFGLVATVREGTADRRLTATNVFVGTADYIAPEQVQGRPADARSDLYALGVVLYEMLAGTVPFAGRAPLEALRAHVEDAPPPLPLEVPPAARSVVERAMQKDPAARYASAEDMARALAAAREQLQGS
jgi:CRP-like cAMP-binding protein